MPRRKKTSNYKKLFFFTLKDKYPYFLLGAATIIVILTLIINYFFTKNRVKKSIKKAVETEASQTSKVLQKEKLSTYIVKPGDNLWSIAENAYGSGYNAYDIASANHIENPNLILADQSLILPSVTPKQPTRGEIILASTQQVTYTESKYTVKTGDCLWKIALQAYGDGYAWMRIAKANNLANPDIIHPGNILTLLR